MLLQLESGFNELLNAGVGLAVIVNVAGTPEQELANGVTITVSITGTALSLTTANEVILPMPLAARPTDVLLPVQR